MPVEEALEQFAARTSSRDMDLWVDAMLIHRQTGGSLARVVESLASRVTQRINLRSEIRALTAQGRMSGLVVSAAPLVFFLVLSIGSREQMEVLYTTPLGWVILIAGLTMNALGLLWIKLVLRITTMMELLLAGMWAVVLSGSPSTVPAHRDPVVVAPGGAFWRARRRRTNRGPTASGSAVHRVGKGSRQPGKPAGRTDTSAGSTLATSSGSPDYAAAVAGFALGLLAGPMALVCPRRWPRSGYRLPEVLVVAGGSPAAGAGGHGSSRRPRPARGVHPRRAEPGAVAAAGGRRAPGALLGEELNRTLAEIELGVPRQVALRSLAERNPNGDLEALVGVLENCRTLRHPGVRSLESFSPPRCGAAAAGPPRSRPARRRSRSCSH